MTRTAIKRKPVAEYKRSTIKNSSSKVSKRSKACDISDKVKKQVWERDGGQCIFCGSFTAMPNAHVIPRSDGGLGVVENIVTACIHCHHELDNTVRRKEMLVTAQEYVKERYQQLTDDVVRYKKLNYIGK